MTKFSSWCHIVEIDSPPHKVTLHSALVAQVPNAVALVVGTVPEHYVAPSRLEQIFKDLGKPAVAAHVANKLPTDKKIKSGDLGEVLCTNYVHEQTSYKLGIKRLRWKDSRNMSMRGEDLLAFSLGADSKDLRVLKGETKSRISVSNTVLNEARAGLATCSERPSPHALEFVADQLNAPSDKPLRDALDKVNLVTGMDLSQVEHLLFTFSGNDPATAFATSLKSYKGSVPQRYVSVRVPKHQEFIENVFKALGV